jgi:hypothetical protein
MTAILSIVLGLCAAVSPAVFAEDDGLDDCINPDNCIFVMCVCLKMFGEDVDDHLTIECDNDYDDGTLTCACTCDFDDSDLICFEGGYNPECDLVPGSLPGTGSGFRVFPELAPPDGPCDRPWCHLERELQTLDAPVELVTEDTDTTLSIGFEGVVVQDTSGLITPIVGVSFDAPQLELVEDGGMSEDMNRISAACEADVNGDGLPDGRFLAEPGGWSCCKGSYGCYACDAEGYYIACDSQSCTVDQIVEHYEPLPEELFVSDVATPELTILEQPAVDDTEEVAEVALDAVSPTTQSEMDEVAEAEEPQSTHEASRTTRTDPRSRRRR